ncbi:MAG: hypothetical protein K9N09_03405 [Candidatus Cloacimonetes bacterium]|nr:hypothetical protein [Candidatus Cloacimonadota bacterium]MCF7813431.1 hypothetical protein [Candidatus Cloacimonadota bacterium]MCF7867724.1 hypothetical protein [Candidatus Cloacimonadota bacterium]MCF7883190.1 hypothetical protein [Candidatus Cloacimonadota bacterium]
MNKILIFSIILATLLICSCTGKAMFKEIKTNTDQLQNLTIMGYGTGSSKSPNLAKAKAKTYAFANLAEQISGKNFSYQKNNGSITFKTNTQATISGSEEVASVYIGDHTYFTILSTKFSRENSSTNDSWLLDTEYKTQDLEKSFIEKYQQAVQQVIDKRFSNINRLEGRLFLTNIDVQYDESSKQFSVKMQVLIVVEG